MQTAIALSRRALGTTWPNPAVGCVLVREGAVVGQGFTQPGGRPHAETQALAMAGQAARGAIAYVTLEPCSHHGQTPPCADALIAAGVSRVVVAATDPDPRVSGSGLARLRDAGIEVVEHVETAAATEVLAGFFSRIRQGRPLVTLKLASTLDGRIATHAGESQWITATPARKAAHALRGQHDAVLMGVGTVLSDDPDMSPRFELEGLESRTLLSTIPAATATAAPIGLTNFLSDTTTSGWQCDQSNGDDQPLQRPAVGCGLGYRYLELEAPPL